MRYSETCGSYHDFLDNRLLLTRKVLTQVFLVVKLKSSLRSMELNGINMSFLIPWHPTDLRLMFICSLNVLIQSAHLVTLSGIPCHYAQKQIKQTKMSNNHTFFFILVSGTIAGSVVGGLIAIGIIVALIVYCARKSTVAILLQVA